MKLRTTGLALLAVWMGCAGAVVAAEVPAAVAPSTSPAIAAPATVEAPPPVEVDGLDADATCESADASMAEPAVGSDVADSAAQAAACKPCKGRTWCKCTYNGQPRSSCDPCCYTNNIGVTVCLD